MANTIQLDGKLIAGPLSVGDCSFPAGVINIPFSLLPSQKSAAVQASQVRNLNSPASFAALDGVGSGETVSQGTTLYLKTNAPMQVRLTMQPTAGPDVVSIVIVQGLLIAEFPSPNYLKLLEAQGVGSIEYYVAGNV